MPPSPSLRRSPKREQKMDNIHKRVRSFESGLTLRSKEDDLALFNDMQNKEREGFLLHTADDFDDSLSKLRYLSDFKLGITIPARGERSDMLYVDGEKNDYDWLLTPPDTPLFSSLDDEEPQPHKLPQRGRPRSQPINVSRLSMNENTHRNSRSSASPRRLSPSPHPSNNNGQLMSRSSSATRSSPPHVLRTATPSPSRRPSTPPNRPSTPNRRSSTPTPRRMSTGSSGQAPSSVIRGTSPMRASRGNSASPKLRAWQSNIPGFPSDAPPNLRTSLSDRPSPHTRGLSSSPRSGRGRHSMSPASRSASSSHSNERDVFSSYSKGSVASSGDDDADFLHSMAISRSPPTRRNGMSGNSRPLTVSKKPSRTSPANSMPKRSFESMIHQMDQRKTPQNMFRPLLSSVPATTFFAGKASNTQRPMFSRNSSLTTSTSASSDQGASVAPDMEGSEHDQNDLAGECERADEPQIQEEMFIFDKVDGIIGQGAQELQAGNPRSDSGGFDAGTSNKVAACAFEGSMVDFDGVTATPAASESMYVSGDTSVVDGCEIMAICSKCGRRFRLLEVNGKIDVCQECVKIDGLFAAAERLLSPTAKRSQFVQSEMVVEADAPVNEVQLHTEVPKLLESSIDGIVLGQQKNKIEKGDNCVGNSSPQLVMNQSEPQPSDQHLDSQQDVNSTQSGSAGKSGDAKAISHPSFGIDDPEAKGISVLLPNRLSSDRCPVVQARSLSATNIVCAEPSYVRDGTSAMKRSIGRDSASTSSSVDLGSSRQTDVRIQHRYSSRKIEVDSVRSDTDAKSQCSGSHSELTLNPYELSAPPKEDTTEYFTNFTNGVENETSQETILVCGKLDSSLDYTDFNSTDVYSCRAIDSDSCFNADCCDLNHTQKDASQSQLSSHIERCRSETLSTENRNDEDLPLCINSSEDPWRENDSSLDIEVPNSSPDSLIVLEQSMLNGSACQSDISDVATHSSLILILESQNDDDSSQDQHAEHALNQLPSNVDALNICSVSATSEKGDDVSTSESGFIPHVHHIHEESTVIVEGPRGHTSRSLTLAEATDTILFCSSIIHDIAYKAATIGMEKELAVPPETSRPTVTILTKSFNGQNAVMRNPNKNTLKSRKFKRKKLETQAKSPLTESETNVVVQESTPLVNCENIPRKAPDTIKPPKLESKCNCTVM